MPTQMMQSILDQPQALRRLLEAGLGAENFIETFIKRRIRKVWIVGSGTSLYASMIAARSWEAELGIDCEAMSSLEFLEEARSGLWPDALVLAISQSGASLILLDAIRQANAAGAVTAVITAHLDAPIPREAHFAFQTLTGVESNLGKCKGFTTTAFAALLLGRRLAMGAQDNADCALRAQYGDVPELMAATIQQSLPAIADWVVKFRLANVLFVVGAGVQVPIALEGALKVLEVAKMPVLARELEEMMHGPFNGVGPEAGIVLITDELAQAQRVSAFVEGAALIGTVFASVSSYSTLPPVNVDLVLPPSDDPGIRTILGVVPFQLLAHDLAVARGVNVDTARYPQLYPVFASKSVHKIADDGAKSGDLPCK